MQSKRFQDVLSSYPPFRVSCSLSDFRKKWDFLKNGEHIDNEEVKVAGICRVLFLILGRIISKRSSGSKLFFYDIRSGETMLQVLSSLTSYDFGSMNESEVVAKTLMLPRESRRSSKSIKTYVWAM